MEKLTCSVADCDKPVKRATYCYGHYMKNWRYGTPTPNHPPKWEDVRGEKFGTLTPIRRDGNQWICQCDCGETVRRRTGELNRSGDASICGAPGKHLTAENYSAAHRRVVDTRGPAKNHQCVSCGTQAFHWSYDHLDPDERHEYGVSVNPVAYSMNPDHYQPRCVPCHKRYDLGRRDSHLYGVT